MNVDREFKSGALKDKAQLMGALANPIRLGMLASLLQGPANVGELVERFDEDQTKVSKHLAVLRKAGLVTCEVDGRCRIYALADAKTVRKILDCLEKMHLPA